MWMTGFSETTHDTRVCSSAFGEPCEFKYRLICKVVGGVLDWFIIQVIRFIDFAVISGSMNCAGSDWAWELNGASSERIGIRIWFRIKIQWGNSEVFWNWKTPRNA